mmetsp:Transcript_16105/g.36094  ORF Transcript_16105/g.36094 Transcript_16105/m.36094 type:complete len:196 (-) Transcript_16105:147-734(-)
MKHHPDVNKDDPKAAERFKRITSAYTQALLASSREGAIQGATANAPGARGGVRQSTPPRTPGGGTVPKGRFNVREWEAAHYGMHGGPADAKRSEFFRTVWRQRGPAAGARRDAGPGSAGRGRAPPRTAAPSARSSTFSMFIASTLAVVTVWTLVFQTNARKWNQWGLGYLAPPEGRPNAKAKSTSKSTPGTKKRR